MMHINQHYVQRAILNNFSNSTSKNKKVNIIDIVDFSVKLVDTRKAMTVKNLYDFSFSEDKELEIKLNHKIERPFVELINIIKNKDEEIELTRKEHEIIKKYLLIQIYRNYKNMTGYTNPPENSFELSSYDLKERESKVDFWRREMSYILDNDLYTIMSNDKFIGVKHYLNKIYSSFLMFFKTNDEFVINDSNIVIERIPVKINPEFQEEYIKTAELMGKNLYNVDGFEEIAKKEIENNKSYIDNFMLFAVSPNFAIVLVDRLWKEKLLGIKIDNLVSNILDKHLIIPKNIYKNTHMFKKEYNHLLKRYLYRPKINDPSIYSEEDIFKYNVVTLNEQETIYINLLGINETYRYLCYKNHDNMIKMIQNYNHLSDLGVNNIKKNYGGYVDLIIQHKEKEE